MFDIIIIGGGPAGLTAAIYSARANKSVLVIENTAIGGQISSSPKVENFPGFKSIGGAELGEKLFDQASDLGVSFEFCSVEKITQKDNKNIIQTDLGEFESIAVIIATGARHRHLNIENEEKLIGHGIAYCVVCDGEFYSGKNVGVVGGGNTALQSAIYLSNICKHVTIIQNLDFLTGEKSLVDETLSKNNVSVIYGAVISKLFGEEELNSVEIDQNGKKQKLSLDGLFVSIGQVPQNDNFKDVVKLNEYGYIISDESCTTSNPSIFVAGDCRTKRIRQLTTAVADGTVASIMACSYVDKNKK